MPKPARTEGHVFIAASLDGFIARADDDIDWLTPYASSGEDTGYDAFMARMDGLIMGRRTYEKTLTFDGWDPGKPVVVMSRSDRPLAASKLDVRLSHAAPGELMATLAEDGWTRAYVDGGQIVQAFLKAEMITDITLTRVPILLGGGRPLFGELGREIALTPIATTAFRSGLVQSRYAVAR